MRADINNAATPPVSSLHAGMRLRVPKKLAKPARHKSRLNALAVWLDPADTTPWMEVRAGGILEVCGRAKHINGDVWRKVRSPDGTVDGYALASSLVHLDVLPIAAQTHRPRQPKPLPLVPTLYDWAYVGVNAPVIPTNIGQCIAIDYDHLPDPDHLGLATFRMQDGRARRAWLIHAQKTQPPEEFA